ncbi:MULTISPECIES: hypothetical protein [unclassified Oceanobacillus]|uniref:phage tail protein n=1 Tax=unclassified Oceanobacillus TaxID=2630292 RepID=UPI001BEC2CB2|nr:MULTISPECIES: hypothetical protein [unclassified Oceanobacillus]MBT2601427.1 hypothetical protein [Oceanobacillus sp. ISL-74]MBT2653296.1 hypothetical protein [Oceanobacillus sp. ISL-73]
MLELFKLAGRIDLEGQEQAEQGLSDIDKKAEGVGSKFGGMAKKVGKAGVVVAGAVTAAGAAAGVAMVKYGNMADELLDLSAITGMSTDEMQRWRQLAVDAGVDTNIVSSSLQRLNGQLERGNQLSPRLAKGFDAMGISAEEFKNMGADEQMRAIVGQMLEMEGADRRAFANQMNMADMLPLIAEMESKGKSVDEIMNEIDVPFSEDDLSTMNEFRKTWDNFKQTVFETIGQALMPLFNWFNENLPLIQSIISTTFEIISGVFTTFWETIQLGISWLQLLFTSNQETMTGIWTTIQEYFTLVVEFLMQAWEQIKIFWFENGQAILENVMTVFQSIWETVQTVFTAVWGIIQQIIGYIVPFIQTQLERIQEFWNQNGEQIMQAVENAFSIIQGIIEFVMPLVTNIIENAWNIISSVFDAAVGIIMGIVKTLSSLLTGDFEGIKEGLTKIWESLWDGIKGIVSGAWDLLSGAFSTLWDSISGWFGDLKDTAVDWGKNMIDGFIDGIKQMGEKVKNAAEGIMNNVKGFLGFNSPSEEGPGRFITHWGRNMVDGFNDGIKDEEQTVAKSVKEVMHKVEPIMNPRNLAGSTGGRSNNTGQSTTVNTNAGVEGLLVQLIEAVQQDKVFNLNGRHFAKAIGDDMANEGGERLRYTERGLAT